MLSHVIFFSALLSYVIAQYEVGIGIADVTGPAAGVNLMGYAKLGQNSEGIHMRLRSRAFVIKDEHGTQLVYINADLAMIDQAITNRVIATLSQQFGETVFNEKNVMVSATHTHSGPGGYLQYLLYTLTAKGFVRNNFNTIVDGIVQSVERAIKNMQKADIYYHEDKLYNASINRSPYSYLHNPEEERLKYEDNTDKHMYMLRFVSLAGENLGSINWFAVHPTSMNNTNTLISGDNKGWASLLMERHFNGPDVLDGRGKYVAAFSAANLGDVSPNILGPRCIDTGLPCDFATSTCNGRNENCIAFGPGVDMVDSTRIIAERQFEVAKKMYDSEKGIKITGPLQFVHQNVQMSNQTVTLDNGQNVTTCPSAMGYSFAAGTTDGPGQFNFEQGTNSPNAFWNLVRNFISRPTPELSECHHPKPILLATGQLNFPFDWQPQIVPTQLFRIGSVYIAGVPGEFTTMSGRRLRRALRAAIRGEKPSESTYHDGNANEPEQIMINGLTNAYSSYIATFEEYQVQRYEGASTIYGPHTLSAYIEQFKRLATYMKNNEQAPKGPNAPDLLEKQISLNPNIIFDLPFKGSDFGSVLQQPNATYIPGQTVQVIFVAGNPRNDFRTDSSFLYVEQQQKDLSWKIIAEDAAIETRFHWKKENTLKKSKAVIEWDIPINQSLGIYRIRHVGTYKNLLQQLKPYSGISNEFALQQV